MFEANKAITNQLPKTGPTSDKSLRGGKKGSIFISHTQMIAL